MFERGLWARVPGNGRSRCTPWASSQSCLASAGEPGPGSCVDCVLSHVDMGADVEVFGQTGGGGQSVVACR